MVAAGWVAMPLGCVKWFDVKKGYGFIECAEPEADVFVHHSGIAGEGYRQLKKGDQVEFDLTETEKGPQAVNVRQPDSEEPADSTGGSAEA